MRRHLGEAPAGFPHETEVVVERDLGIVPALEEHGRGALGGGELHLLQHLFERKSVGLGVARLAVEGAELAVGDADVGVVGVGVDDEGDDFLRVEAEPCRLGQRSQLQQGSFGQEPAPFLAREALARVDLFFDLAQHRSFSRSSRSRLNSAIAFSSSAPRR